jgi:hypothetical protein
VYPIRCTSGAGVPTRGTSYWGHPSRVERWQDLKAQPIPYLTKSPTATTKEIFNYLRDPRVHQAVMTMEGKQPNGTPVPDHLCRSQTLHTHMCPSGP